MSVAMARPTTFGVRDQALRNMQRAADEAAGALREVCMVLDEIALDTSVARHANRTPLRLSSNRIENITRTLISEVNACGPVGAKHAAIIGKVTLAAATISFLPFAEDAGQQAVHRFKASHERAMRNLEWVHQYAESAQSETRSELSLQIKALAGELDRLAAKVGVEIAQQRRHELDEAMDVRQLPARWALEGVDQVLEQARLDEQRASADGNGGSLFGSTSDHLIRLAEIEFTIAEIFAQLTGDDI
jgi:hypothetical protein